MNWKGFGREHSWHNSRTIPACLETGKTHTKSQVRINSVPPKIQTRYLPNTS
jgi:hypothetical protein